MSTIYGILVEDYSRGVEEYDGKYYVEVAFVTNSGVIYFTNPLASLLPDDVEVTALDNDPQGIYTIGDIKQEVNDNNMLVERRSH